MVRYIGIRTAYNTAELAKDVANTLSDAEKKKFRFDYGSAANEFSAQTAADPGTNLQDVSMLPAHFLDQVSEDITVDRGLIFPETSAQRVMRNRIPGQIAIGGDIQIPFYSQGTPTLIYYALGSATTTGAGPYLHKIRSRFNRDREGNPGPRVFQMSIGKDGNNTDARKEHRFVGCVVRTMTFDFDPSETVLVTFGIMCRQEIAAVALKKRQTGMLHDLTTMNFPNYNTKERVPGGTEMVIMRAGAKENSLESASIEVDNGFIDDNFAIGSRFLPSAYEQNFTVSGSLEFGYDSHTKYQNVLDEAKWSMDFNGPTLRGGKTGGDNTNSADRQVKVNLPQIALTNVSLPTEGTDRYILSVDYQGERTTDNDLIKVDVVNGETGPRLVI